MKKKRKRVQARCETNKAVDDDYRYGYECDYDCEYDYDDSWFDPSEEFGNALAAGLQAIVRFGYTVSKGMSESSHNPRQHLRSDGREKKPYDSLYKAKSAVADWWEKGEDMSPYPCDTCGYIHIGHRHGEQHSTAYILYSLASISRCIPPLVCSISRLFKSDSSLTCY